MRDGAEVSTVSFYRFGRSRTESQEVERRLRRGTVGVMLNERSGCKVFQASLRQLPRQTRERHVMIHLLFRH